MKKALITGITGQDGSYLAELLLSKGYEVHGLKRRSSSFNTERIDHLRQSFQDNDLSKLFLHYGDMTDSANLIRLIQEIQPNEIYNLAAQSHVHISFEIPEYTANSDAIGCLRLLEAIRICGLEKSCRFYQASTSEMYGGIGYNMPEKGYNEESEFHPKSPYGAAKLYAHRITKNYRESYGMFACSGILFNHESPRRGESFVTRKITIAVARIKKGLQEKLYIGNMYSKRDWGHAKDYVEGMRLMLQQDTPKDYILATGETYTVKDFINWSFEEIGIILERKGVGKDEKGYDMSTGKCVVEIDPIYFRPSEVDLLLGDSSKAQNELGWISKYDAKSLCKEMVQHDLSH